MESKLLFVISDQIFASESRRAIDRAQRTDPCWDSCCCLAELLKPGGINDCDTRYRVASADYVPSSLSLAGDRDSRKKKQVGYYRMLGVQIRVNPPYL